MTSARKRLQRLSVDADAAIASAGRWRRAAGVVAVGLATAVVFGGWGGAATGIAATVTIHHIWKRAESTRVKTDRRHASADLPFALDVLSACLRAGIPIAEAVRCCSSAVTPHLGEALRRSALALSLGTPVAEAFEELSDLPTAARVAEAVARSERTGASLAAGFSLLAAELRDERQLEAQSAAQRAGVWLVLPLCLCFLPAFVAAGLLPIVISVLAEVLHTF